VAAQHEVRGLDDGSEGAACKQANQTLHALAASREGRVLASERMATGVLCDRRTTPPAPHPPAHLCADGLEVGKAVREGRDLSGACVNEEGVVEQVWVCVRLWVSDWGGGQCDSRAAGRYEEGRSVRGGQDQSTDAARQCVSSSALRVTNSQTKVKSRG
jgi:hypothetical protein